MAGLTGKTIASTYKSLLKTSDNSSGISTSLARVTDGEGTDSCLEIADDELRITPQNDDGTGVFSVRDKDSNHLLRVDSSNDVVKVNSGQDIANTQYANFHMNNTWWAGASANTHYPLSFNSNNVVALCSFGTGTDPATSFTTAEGTATRSSELVPFLWYVMDNITIDSIVSIEGADTATGDTTRMHAQSYTFTDGATTCLTAGTLLASNSDITNAGSEQAYKSTWTIDSADVDAGKVILTFLESDSVNSDYSVNIYIKYHLR